MDSLRGHLSDHGSPQDGYRSDFEDDTDREPPISIGQDERRMQVRAYNLWASLLDNRNFPSVEDLDAENIPDFGPYSVLLDFTEGLENPAVQFLGAKLAEECGTDGPIARLSDVPSRSLLSRITDHYMQILANQAPIGFEAEFVNQRGSTLLYRGILLPFSSDDDTIDFIYGVINWKELADQQTTDELLLEIDQALETAPELPIRDALLGDEPLTEWADGPADNGGILDLTFPVDAAGAGVDWPEPAFGIDPLQEIADDLPFPEAPAADALKPLHLADWLASARELARAAKGSEDRSRHALYAAIGRAYDFSLAAAAAPDEFAALVADAGLTVQDRAPMTPVVKLVFGADYDKTRLTEYAAALGYAHRLSLRDGTLADYIEQAPGGLKGIVNAERRMRREESGKTATPREAPRTALARKLRKLSHAPLSEVEPDGAEFTLLVARRMPGGEVVLLGEVADDVPMIERAARRLLGQG